ncbi:uncharacterized protein LOC112521471 isoform X2 [Cynara cardunculus var. scolymus]|uniref:uncharacterized protein LOC112521471 isoform X2 n=1 Tax=Cynara cardunculus var. scolymus TaxID=59895 RepID=UPI000D62672E|nr:uncharacterized protein LOC112521471 isoform X2 [Cynara cardunculus var. scolymus]
MEWKKCYLDVILVPLSFFITIGYHLWLWHKVRNQPLTTIIGTNNRGRRLWVSAIMENLNVLSWNREYNGVQFRARIQDNDKKNILAVQTLRNTIMGATLMATTSILLCSGLAAVISSTYSIKKPINDTVYGAHGEFMVALKYVTLLLVFLASFMCHSLSIRFINQVNFLINCPSESSVTCEYVAELLEKGFTLNAVGNRLFYSALPIVLWIFGPVLVFVCSVTMVSMLYNLDFVFGKLKEEKMSEIPNGV